MTHFKEILDIYLNPLCGFLMEKSVSTHVPKRHSDRNITNEKNEKVWKQTTSYQTRVRKTHVNVDP